MLSDGQAACLTVNAVAPADGPEYVDSLLQMFGSGEIRALFSALSSFSPTQTSMRVLHMEGAIFP